ncbi:hypothetical protein AeNC1_008269 [Aphanomyces euteiches]|nr:hypothetical protein AeNC1_008269 [Aphanomyces euteiches]
MNIPQHDPPAMMLLHHSSLVQERPPEGLINLRALHGDDTINNEVTFATGRDAKYFLQDYCFNHNKSMKLRVGKNSGNSKTFVCTSAPQCEWRVVATKSKRKNEEACFYFSTIHNVHSPGCTSTRKPSERQHMILTSSQNLVHNTTVLPLGFEHVEKKPRRENPVDKIVKTLIEANADRQKLSTKSIRDIFFNRRGYSISAHAATRAKQVFLGIPPMLDPSQASPSHNTAAKTQVAIPPPMPTFRDMRQQFQDIQAIVEQNKMIEAAFTRAASIGDVSAVRTFLRHGKMDLVNSNGSVALLLATKGHFLNVVDCLLSHGAKTEAIDETGVTALFHAVQMSQFHIAKCLLDHGARVDTTDENSRTPLLVAASQGDLKMVKLLVKRKANVDASDEDDNTPLIVATRQGHTDVVEFLLKKGANRHVENLDGQTAVGLASAFQGYEMAQLYASNDHI